jgi:CRP-like cAMP-binding protein
MVNEESYSDKEAILEEGAKGHWVYVILEGQAKVKRRTPTGLLTVGNLKQGDVFGEMALLGKPKGVRTASVIADGPVKIGLLDHDRLVEEYESLSPQLREMMQTLVLRLKETTDEIRAILPGSVK